MDPVNVNLSPANYFFSNEEEMGKSITEKKIGTYAIDVLTKTQEIQHTDTPLIKKFNEENEPDINLELEEELDQALTSNVCEMPLDSVFLDTDLIILKDDYKGSMPINGIKEKDFKEISLLFSNICMGNSKLKINGNAPEFLNPVKESIKTLLTREIGRTLLTQICQRETDLPITLKNSYVEGTGTFSESSSGSAIEISSACEETGYIEIHPSGKLKLNQRPLYIALGHELIHAIHPDVSADVNRSPSLGREYTNREEQMTIVGLRQYLVLKTTSSNWEPVIHKDYYNELNERNLTAAFTGGKNKWYPRNGHNSAIIRKEGNIKEHITSLIQNKVAYDLEKIFEDTINVNKLLFPNSILNIALETGAIDILKFLITKDPSSAHTKSQGIPLFSRAVQLCDLDTNTYLSILEIIHEAKSDINATDDQGNTALFYMLKNTFKNKDKVIRNFLKWGGDPHLKNKEGKTAIECYDEFVDRACDPYRLLNLHRSIKAIQDSAKLLKNSIVTNQWSD